MEESLSFSLNGHPFSRLVDYIAVIEFDKERLADDNIGAGIVTQRFPRSDREDIPFPPSLAAICRPQEWRLSCEKRPALWHTEILTDLNGQHQYACFLEVQEKCTALDVIDIDKLSSTLYKPKIFLLLSRYSLFRLFSICLHKLSVAHCSGDNASAENMMATLLEGIPLRIDQTVPFVLGDSRLSVRIPPSHLLPLSDGCVSILARALGVHGLMLCMRAVLSEQKVLLVSSYMRLLSSAAWAINSLLYPFEYSFTQITILPSHLLEYLESPTPFLIGIMRESAQAAESYDTVTVDLDTGRIDVPSNVEIPPFPEGCAQLLSTHLQDVLHPEMRVIDFVSPPPIATQREDVTTDSLIRAVFTRFYADLMQGYRNALLLVRVYPNPRIEFHRAAFLGFRSLNRHAFIECLLNSQLFQLFVSTRGMPYRPCDVFDQEMTKIIKSPEGRQDAMKTLADEIFQNERQDELLWHSRLLQKPPPDPLAQPMLFDENRIEEMCADLRRDKSPETIRSPSKIVPNCPVDVRRPINEELLNKQKKALEDCYIAIREGRVAEARKKMASAEITLRNRYVRVKLCDLLVEGIYPIHRATLQPQQFELIARLVNCALDEESANDEHGIAYSCLHFAWVYSRHLSKGVQQYLYTCIQDHDVWKNERFWESAFFHDVHRSLRRQYISESERGKEPNDMYRIEGGEDAWGLFKDPSGMELVARRLMQWRDIDDEERTRLGEEEESIVFGAAKHYINLMIYMRIPLDTSRLRAIEKQKERLRRNPTVSSDESTEDEGYVDGGKMGGINIQVTKAIRNVIERLSSSTGLPSAQSAALCSLIPDCIEIHIDTLEQVYVETRKLPPPPKLTISNPELCDNERMMMKGLRCYLLNENDKERGVYSLLPAEGLLFLTNYRLIFKGHPINPYYCDEIVIRWLPIMSIIKQKVIDDVGNHLLRDIPSKLIRSLRHCIQIRTSTFVCLTVIFDEESSNDLISELESIIASLRWPATLPSSLVSYDDQSYLFMKPVEKGNTSTMNDLRKAITRLPKGIGTPFSTLLPDNNSTRKKDLIRDIRSMSVEKGANEDFLDISDIMIQSRMSDYTEELRRLRFDSDNGLLRISWANKAYNLSPSYPSQLVVPSTIADEILSKVAKGFKSNRLPVVTWTSTRGALLIRGSAIISPNMVKRFKKQAKGISKEIGNDTLSTMSGSFPQMMRKPPPLTPISSSTHQQEMYLRRLVSCSPSNTGELVSGSYCSLPSNSMESLKSSWTGSALPGSSERSRKASSSIHFTRANAARASVKLSQIASSILSEESDRQSNGSIPQRSLYIFGEKGGHKLLRLDGNIEYIPLQFPSSHDMKESFKRMTKVCKPSVGSSSSGGKSHFTQLADTQWIQLVAQLLEISTATSKLLTYFNSSVAFAIEDGRDATCQIVSLTQIISDPYYRTFEGLQRLIAKEWLAFGHRFSYRSNHSLVSQKSGFAPVFILFLDALQQLLHQFPTAFEYNEFLLRFLAYHSQSTYFRTFVMDSESERCEVERNAPDVKMKHCIWNYIKEQQIRSPIFSNFNYTLSNIQELDPRWALPNLVTWSYYTEDFLSHGPPYDIDACLREISKAAEDRALITESKTTVKAEEAAIVSSSCTNSDVNGKSGFVDALSRLHQVCSVEGQQAFKDACTEWRAQIDGLDTEELDIRDIDSCADRRSIPLHIRRAVLKYVMKGKNRANEVAPTHNTLSPALEHPEHEENQKNEGSFMQGTERHPPLTKGTSKDSENEVISSNNVDEPSRIVAQSVDPGTVAHHGFLYKKGATFKFWKQRWFILDRRHIRLVYHDSPEDGIMKGEIDLRDLRSIEIASNPGVPKKGAAVIEIRTSRRTYSLMANSVEEANVWKRKITEIV